MQSVAKDKSETLIDSERKRLADTRLLREASQNEIVQLLNKTFHLDDEFIIKALQNASTYREFVENLGSRTPRATIGVLKGAPNTFIEALNEVRALFDLPPFATLDDATENSQGQRSRSRKTRE